MASQTTNEVSSRSVSPETSPVQTASLVPQLPAPVEQFFQSISPEGYPSAKSTKPKAQPWRTYWVGPQEPSDDGKLIVACPEKCAYGSNGLGGY